MLPRKDEKHQLKSLLTSTQNVSHYDLVPALLSQLLLFTTQFQFNSTPAQKLFHRQHTNHGGDGERAARLVAFCHKDKRGTLQVARSNPLETPDLLYCCRLLHLVNHVLTRHQVHNPLDEQKKTKQKKKNSQHVLSPVETCRALVEEPQL